MAFIGPFDATKIEERADFSPVPPGDYMCVISNSSEQNTKGGKAFKFELDIVSGEYQGRKLFEFLNLVHTNELTVKIAQQSLAEMCKAVNMVNIQDTSQLHGKRLIARVAIEEGGREYVDNSGNKKVTTAQNKIKKYMPISGVVSASATQPQEGQDSKPVWKR